MLSCDQRLLVFLSICLTLGACSGQPLDEPPGTVAPAAPAEEASFEPSDTERLVSVTPTAWKRIYQINTDQGRLSEFVPQDQNAMNWITKLSFESHPAAGLLIDPISLLQAEAAEDEKKCRFVQQFNIFSGYENGYETSVRLFLCGRNEFAGKGEIKLVKAIRGESSYYFVRISERVAPFKVGEPQFARDAMADWSSFLSTIYVCDDTEAHPCKPPGSLE